MSRDYFADIAPIAFEGPDSRNPLAYRYYDRKRVVLGKSMEEQLRIAVCFWHSFCWAGHDIFGVGTFKRPWAPGGHVSPEMAQLKLENAFSFIKRLGVPYYCFHDVDAMATAGNIREHVENMASIVEALAKKQSESGIKLLWGTANLF